jgi:ferrous iron transport protein B
MWDAALDSGVQIRKELLANEFGIPVVATTASRREGLDNLKLAVVNGLKSSEASARTPRMEFQTLMLSEPIQKEVGRLVQTLQTARVSENKYCSFLVARSLLDPGGSVETMLISAGGDAFRKGLLSSRQSLSAQKLEVPGVEAEQRYRRISEILARVQSRLPQTRTRVTDRLDAILTHQIAGLAICLAVLLLVFSTIYWFAAPLSEGVDTLLGMLSDQVQSRLAPGPLRSLLTEGLIGGVGSVLVFLPQICLLFFFIGLLEDARRS